MSIRDLIASGIEIQGSVCIKRWDEKIETYNVLLETHEFQTDFTSALYCFADIKYVYATQGQLVIEIA